MLTENTCFQDDFYFTSFGYLRTYTCQSTSTRCRAFGKFSFSLIPTSFVTSPITLHTIHAHLPSRARHNRLKISSPFACKYILVISTLIQLCDYTVAGGNLLANIPPTLPPHIAIPRYVCVRVNML